MFRPSLGIFRYHRICLAKFILIVSDGVKWSAGWNFFLGVDGVCHFFLSCNQIGPVSKYSERLHDYYGITNDGGVKKKNTRQSLKRPLMAFREIIFYEFIYKQIVTRKGKIVNHTLYIFLFQRINLIYLIFNPIFFSSNYNDVWSL